MSQGDGQRSVDGLAQLPIIKLSLIAAYLWFPLCPCSPHHSTHCCAKGEPEPCCHCQLSIDMALLVFPLL